MAMQATQRFTGLVVSHSSADGIGVVTIWEPERVEDGAGIYTVTGATARGLPWLGDLLRSLGFRFKRTVPPRGDQEWARPGRAVVVDEVRFRVVE